MSRCQHWLEKHATAPCTGIIRPSHWAQRNKICDIAMTIAALQEQTQPCCSVMCVQEHMTDAPVCSVSSMMALQMGRCEEGLSSPNSESVWPNLGVAVCFIWLGLLLVKRSLKRCTDSESCLGHCLSRMLLAVLRAPEVADKSTQKSCTTYGTCMCMCVIQCTTQRLLAAISGQSNAN